jgi:ESS family glutamate:Na+ symporter
VPIAPHFVAAATYSLGALHVLALGCVAIALGTWLKKRLRLLDRLCIPTPIVGAFVFALVALALHGRVINFQFDTVLRDLLMIAFMTTIGLNARLELIRRGGIPVLLMLALGSVGAVLQNLSGIGLAKVMGLNPLIGILSGSVALTGGPGTALAFGPTFEKMGVTGAAEVGAASAIFGITVAGLLSGYIGSRLIRRNKLGYRSQVTGCSRTQNQEQNITTKAPATAGRLRHGGYTEKSFGDGKTKSNTEDKPESTEQQNTASLLTAVLLIGVAMGVGSLISGGFERVHMVLPPYIGAMIVAAFIRNVNDRFSFFPISQASVNSCALVALYLFIAMAVLTLRLWELAHLVLPMFVILAVQVALCWVMSAMACFYLMGRNYEAAVMSSGFCGFMLGITANAVASMEELVEKFGPAPKSFLVVPVVGAFLIDFMNSLIITAMANWAK